MITNEYINHAIDYILNNISENISVDDIAAHCNFSRYYFSRMFKMETGESIYDECLYDICITAPEGCKLENTYVLKGGKFANYHFKGLVKKTYTSYQSIFNVWLP